MCGIAGIVNFDSKKLNPDILISIKNSLEHRGPDTSSILNINDSTSFIHTRLAIIDLDSRSDQPMTSHNGRYNIVFNGEIYNFKELRSDLENKGVSFRTNGDTEVLLELFAHYGHKSVHLLRGQFAFAIYDNTENSLFLCRDRVGIKPIYYSIYNKKFIFGSELKALEGSSLIPFEPDYESYVSYLRHLCVPYSNTGNRNIKKLEPGTWIKVSDNLELQKFKYWDPFKIEVNNDLTKEEAVLKTDKLIQESIEYRNVSDVEVGLFLSGGLDSSLIGSIMKNQLGSKIKGFNIDYEEKFDGYAGESEEATFAANHIGLDLVKDKIKYLDYKQILNNYTFFQDDLIGDEVGIPLFFLGRSTKSKSIKVVQVGEGADELFYGYEHWLRLLNLSRYIRPILSSSRTLNNFTNHRLNLFSNIIFNRTPFAGGALGFNLAEINSLITQNVFSDFKNVHKVDNKWQEYNKQDHPSLSKWMTKIDLEIRLPELLLMRMDKLVMQSSIEARVPFLDHKLIEFVLSIPDKYIVSSSSTKPLLKNIAKRHIPESIYNRKKQGFRAPIGEWIKKDEALFYDSIYEFNQLTQLFNNDELKKQITGNDYQKKWYLANLANWHLSRV
jgi:asparagine synthase (glutamine-hydrolysing)